MRRVRHMRHVCFAVLAVFVLGGAVAGTPPQAVSACTVGVVPTPPLTRDQVRAIAADAFGRSDAVFRGRVVKIGVVGPEAVIFETDLWWKGTPTATVAVRAVANGCGYGFTPGQEYIVYAEAYSGGFGEAFMVRPGTLSHLAPTTDGEDDAFAQIAGPPLPVLPAPVPLPPTPAGGACGPFGDWFGLLIGDAGASLCSWRQVAV